MIIVWPITYLVYSYIKKNNSVTSRTPSSVPQNASSRNRRTLPMQSICLRINTIICAILLKTSSTIQNLPTAQKQSMSEYLAALSPSEEIQRDASDSRIPPLLVVRGFHTSRNGSSLSCLLLENLIFTISQQQAGTRVWVGMSYWKTWLRRADFLSSRPTSCCWTSPSTMRRRSPWSTWVYRTTSRSVWRDLSGSCWHSMVTTSPPTPPPIAAPRPAGVRSFRNLGASPIFRLDPCRSEAWACGVLSHLSQSGRALWHPHLVLLQGGHTLHTPGQERLSRHVAV